MTVNWHIADENRREKTYFADIEADINDGEVTSVRLCCYERTSGPYQDITPVFNALKAMGL